MQDLYFYEAYRSLRLEMDFIPASLLQIAIDEFGSSHDRQRGDIC